MATSEKSGHSDAAEGVYPAHPYPQVSSMDPPQGYAPPQYGGSPMTQPQGGAYPQPYVTQPQGTGNVTSPYVMQPQGAVNVTSPYVTQPQYNQYGSPVIMTTQPVREAGPPPDTTCSLVVSILAIFFCLGAWPFAVVAVIFNRKAKTQVDMGQYTLAKGALRTCIIFIAVTVVLGIIAWIIFAIRVNAMRYRYRYYG
ncbi:hypothetical protein ACOMHN_024499 [Nucella lapillus]